MPKETRFLTLGVNFNDSTQPISFDILWTSDDIPQKATVSLKVSIGELIKPVSMPEAMFLEEQSNFLNDF